MLESQIGKALVRQIHGVADDRPASRSDDCRVTDPRVDLSKDLNAGYKRAIGIPTVDFAHELSQRNVRRLKPRFGDVGQFKTIRGIVTSDHVYFTLAERTLTVKEDLKRGVFNLIGCNVHLLPNVQFVHR